MKNRFSLRKLLRYRTFEQVRRQWTVAFGNRFALWTAAWISALVLDLLTKALPHPSIAYNYAHTPPLALALAAAFLCALCLSRSILVIFGSGIMLGALLGNGGQLIAEGHVSDWLKLGPWLTNLADVLGALGLLLCLAGYLRNVGASAHLT